MKRMRLSRRGRVPAKWAGVAGALATALATALAAPATLAAEPPATGPAKVGPALDRPALALRQPERTVVLGAALAGRRIVVVGERGAVLLSDDNGARWHQATVPVAVTLTAVRFVDAQHGFAVGHGGVVLATTDAGATWQKRFDGLQAARLALADAERTGEPRAIRDARRLVADGADKPLLDLHFFDPRHGIVVGAYGLAFETDDGGASWRSLMTRIDDPKALHLYAIRARGATLLVAGEQGFAARSDDAGRSFRRLELPYKGSFFTAELTAADGHAMLVAGLRGNVWRSGDGGASWTQATVPAPASITGSALLAGSDETASALLANQAGQLLRGRAGSFVPLPAPPLPPLTGVLPLADGSVLALTLAGPVRVPKDAP